MFQDKPEWIAHQRQRWLRPDAERWFRPDAHRFMTPDAQHWLLAERKQAVAPPHSEPVDLAALDRAREHLLRLRDELLSLRAEFKFQQFFRSLKAGFNPDQPRDDHGRWTREGSASSTIGQNSGSTRGGHHFVPREIFDDPGLRLPADTRKVFENGVTGPLNAGPHRWSKEHDIYNDAVRERFNRFLAERGIQPENLSPEQARRFLDEVKRSADPRIRGLNMRIYMREIMYWFRRAPRGNE